MTDWVQTYNPSTSQWTKRNIEDGAVGDSSKHPFHGIRQMSTGELKQFMDQLQTRKPVTEVRPTDPLGDFR